LKRACDKDVMNYKVCCLIQIKCILCFLTWSYMYTYNSSRDRFKSDHIQVEHMTHGEDNYEAALDIHPLYIETLRWHVIASYVLVNLKYHQPILSYNFVFYILIDVRKCGTFCKYWTQHVNGLQSYIVIIMVIHHMHLEALMDEIDVIHYK
jgi:hypothetical protein